MSENQSSIDHTPEAGGAEPPTLPPPAQGGESETSTLAREGLPAATGSYPPPDTPAQPSQPERVHLPGYEILEELGRGGMGVVYKARQVGLNRVVALKMILAGGFAGEADRQRFRTEAEAIARLQHPNIVQIHDVGEAAGHPYFSLEFCDGGSLAQKLAGTPLPSKEAAALLEQLARAVQAAHDKGVIHRDLKPANILLQIIATKNTESPEEEAGAENPGGANVSFGDVSCFSWQSMIPKIADFGLAKKQDEKGRTATGVVMGTPSYMAPEQAEGKGKELGPACDIYALGAILYDCLTGRPPFRAATPLDTILQVVSEEPVAPRQLNAKVALDLETICLKCLHKEPGKRYATAADLADDLGRFQRGEPIVARPVGRAEKVVKWVRRQPVVAGLTAAVLLALVLGTTISAWLAVAAETSARKADKARRQAEAERDQNAWLLYAAQVAQAQREWEDGDANHARALLGESREDLRGWDHAYLSMLFNENQHTLLGHSQSVLSVSYSPDDKRVASGSADGTVKVWDVATGRMVFDLKAHTGPVRSVSFNPEGRRLVSTSDDATIRLWDAQAGQELLAFKSQTRSVSSVSFHPDGRRIASACDNLVKVWDSQTGKEVLTLQESLAGGIARISSVAFSSDGELLAASGGWSAFADPRNEHSQGVVRIWELKSGKEIHLFKGEDKSFTSVRFDPSHKRLAAAGEAGLVKVWDTLTGHEVATFRGHPKGIWSIDFSPDGERLATGDGRGTIQVWEVETGREPVTLKGHVLFVFGVCFSRDGRRLASAGWDQTVKVWNLHAAQNPLILKGHTRGVMGARLTADGLRLASGDGNGEVKVWDMQGFDLVPVDDAAAWVGRLHAPPGQLVRTVQVFGQVHDLTFSPDGKEFATASDTGAVKVWDLQTGRETRSFAVRAGSAWGVCFSPDGKRLAAGGVGFDQARKLAPGEVQVWDVQTGEEVFTLKGHEGGVSSVAFSPDAQRLASGSLDRTVKVWDARSGQELLTLSGHAGAVTRVGFHPDGKHLASASQDRTVKIWDLDTARESVTLEGHSAAVWGLSISPDGKCVATGGLDDAVKIWETHTGRQTLSLKGSAGGVLSVSFSKDGNKLVTGGSDGTVRVWDASSAAVATTP